MVNTVEVRAEQPHDDPGTNVLLAGDDLMRPRPQAAVRPLLPHPSLRGRAAGAWHVSVAGQIPQAMVIEPQHGELRAGPVLLKAEILDELPEFAVGALPGREAWFALGRAADRPQQGQRLMPFLRAGLGRHGGPERVDLLQEVFDGGHFGSLPRFRHLEAQIAEHPGNGGVPTGELIGTQRPAANSPVGDSCDRLGVVSLPTTDEEVANGPAVAVLLKKGVTAQPVELGDGSEHHVTSKLGKHHLMSLYVSIA